MLDSSFTVVVAASLLCGAGYLVFSHVGDSPAAATGVLFVLLFLVAASAGTCVICLDQVSIALHHTEGAALRYALGSIVALCAVGGLALAPGRADPYLGIGWSWPAVRGRGLGMHADAGVRLRLPRAGLDATGMPLADAAADPLGERVAVDGRVRYRPVVSVGLSYGF